MRSRIGLVVLFLAVWTIGCTGQRSETASASSSGSTRANVVEQRRDLSQDEERGGHTLRKHVGRSDEELRERLQRERNIGAASTYTDRATAESVVAQALSREADRVQSWASRSGNRPNLVLDYRGDEQHPIGRTMRRGDHVSEPCSNAVVVLRADGPSYYVLTSYPECR